MYIRGAEGEGDNEMLNTHKHTYTHGCMSKVKCRSIIEAQLL